MPVLVVMVGVMMFVMMAAVRGSLGQSALQKGGHLGLDRSAGQSRAHGHAVPVEVVERPMSHSPHDDDLHPLRLQPTRE